MTEKKTIFIRFDEGQQVEIKTNSETWMDVTDVFVNFLQGCGYIVDRYDIADYLNEDRNWSEEEDTVFNLSTAGGSGTMADSISINTNDNDTITITSSTTGLTTGLWPR